MLPLRVEQSSEEIYRLPHKLKRSCSSQELCTPGSR